MDDRLFMGLSDLRYLNLFYRDDKPPEMFNRSGERVVPEPDQLEKIALLDAAITGQSSARIRGVGHAWRSITLAHPDSATWYTIGYELDINIGDTS